MLKLVTTELDDITQQRLTRMRADARALTSLSRAEIRAAADIIERVRDTLDIVLRRVRHHDDSE